MASSTRTSLFDSPEAFRRSVLLALLFFTALLGLVFAFLNRESNVPAMISELVMAALALVLMPIVRRSDRLFPWSLGYLILFHSTMMFILTGPQTSSSIFAWVLLIPLLSNMLLGRAYGFAVSLVFLSIALAIFVWRYRGDASLGDPVALLNVAGTAVCVFIFSFVYETGRERAALALSRQALTDPLTGLGNRAYLTERFETEKARFDRYGTLLAVLMLDIDYFKSINDAHGHDVGDQALRWLARVLESSLRTNDSVVRFGGEEFCILLSSADLPAAHAAAEKLRTQIAAQRFQIEGETIPVTASIGVALIAQDGQSLDSMLNAADKRLYSAKAQGRNRVVSEAA